MIVYAGNVSYCLDFSVVLCTAKRNINHCATDPKYAIRTREREKKIKHGSAALELHHVFVPMVWDAFGRAGPGVRFFFDALSMACAGRELLREQLNSETDAAIQRGNARIILQASQRVEGCSDRYADWE